MPERKPPGSVRLDLTPDELERLRKALDNYNAYLRSQNRGDTISLQLAERLRDVA